MTKNRNVAANVVQEGDVHVKVTVADVRLTLCPERTTPPCV